MGSNTKIKRVFVFFILIIVYLSIYNVQGKCYHVGINFAIKNIQQALALSKDKDSVVVHFGIYKEGNIVIKKSIFFIGVGMPVLDGQKKFEVVSIKANKVVFEGFVVQKSGFATLDDPGGIKVYNSNDVVIRNNILSDNFFGIYIQYGKNCTIKNNKIKAFGIEEQQIGNGIHCWKCDSMLIIGNTISGHRDGIYFEFVTNSLIWRNISLKNIRYGLHFMFSNNDAYITNLFRSNGSGVAVMFTKKVTMLNNYFEDNWGDASFGLLLKEISDSYLVGNHFYKNTSGIFLEGATRINIEKNSFKDNGWAMKIQASCMENVIENNNFFRNTFDASTNGSLVLNTFNGNYWDKYEGYDLNKDKIGDVPFHPLSLFAVLVEKNPPTMLLFRSFIVTLLDKSERMLPSLTPDNFRDNAPLMKPLPL